MSAAEPDELYTLRNFFWSGNFQQAINEANGLKKLQPHLVIEKDEFLYRSYLALGQHQLITSEIKNIPSTPIGKSFIFIVYIYVYILLYSNFLF